MQDAERILIFGKTYPELSTKYTETVCTGGLREDGRPVRLFPVWLRYLEGNKQYKLYQWIDVPITKSTQDPRPESFRIDPTRLVCRELVDTDGGTWRRRKELVFRDRNWHFGGLDALREAERTTKRSIGLIKPGSVDDVRVIRKEPGEREAFERKRRRLQAVKESDLFDPDYRMLSFLENDIRLYWRCEDRCKTCHRVPHAMNILDWGLLELARREGRDKALSRLQSVANLSKHDFRLFLGTFRLHPKNFGVIGLWYPPLEKESDQMLLL